MYVITDHKFPVYNWAGAVEELTLRQIGNVANLPFLYKHFAVMADAHPGKGMIIGGVVAANAVVIPNAVGSDIGCSMSSVPTNIKVDDIGKSTIRQIMSLIREAIPIGVGAHYQAPQCWDGFLNPPDLPIMAAEIDSAAYQLGTLGSGNHFIEIQVNKKDGSVWFMVHSGSRNFGNKIAKYYHNIARLYCEKYYSNITTPDLAFLPLETNNSRDLILKHGEDYLDAMNYALKFAKASHEHMVTRIKSCFDEVVGPDIQYSPTWYIQHNYARLENHFNKNVVVHRKGAISASLGEIGIIPGCQGDSSFIVRGLGNPKSFWSASHGAGRTMSRTQAKQTLDLEKELMQLDAMGAVHSIRGANDLDEATGAYHNIHTVMENQKDLVEIVAELQPLGTIHAPSFDYRHIKNLRKRGLQE